MHVYYHQKIIIFGLLIEQLYVLLNVMLEKQVSVRRGGNMLKDSCKVHYPLFFLIV